MLYSESDKAHASGSCFPVDQLDNALSLGSFLFEHQGLASASETSKADGAHLSSELWKCLAPGWIYLSPWEDLGTSRRTTSIEAVVHKTLFANSSRCPMEWHRVKDL